MTNRNQLNIELSKGLADLLSTLRSRYKRNGTIGRAALLLLASLPEPAQREFMQTVALKEFLEKLDDYALDVSSGKAWEQIALFLEDDSHPPTAETVLGFWRLLPNAAARVDVVEMMRKELEPSERATLAINPRNHSAAIFNASDLARSEAAAHPPAGDDPHKPGRRRKRKTE